MRKRYEGEAGHARSSVVNAIGRIGRGMLRLMRKAMIARAFAVLPNAAKDNSELGVLLAE
jgi:hypothetical protein